MKKHWEIFPIIVILLLITAMKKPQEIFSYQVVVEMPKSKPIPQEVIDYYRDDLFDYYNVRYELRDLIRQICSLEKVPLEVALGVAQIESWHGTHPGYNNRSAIRMYKTNGVATWDIGYFQLSSYYHEYFGECFFNSELLFSLGYMRESFKAEDDVSSIQVGISYLGYLIKYYQGNTEKAVQAYNAGMGNINKGRIPSKTVNYTKAVLNGDLRVIYD